MDRNELLRSFRALGIASDDLLMVHSSLKSFGYVEGGAETVALALMEAVKDGTLIMPSFNHEKPYTEGQIFDIRRTPTINGAIPDCFWRMDGVFRSMNPTHPYAVWGKNAREIAQAHERGDAMGEGSPLDYLYKHNGKILLLGVGYNRNTFHHYIETVTKAPCLLPQGEAYPVLDADGIKRTARTWSWRNGVCPIDDHAEYAEGMKAYQKVEMIGSCRATCFHAADCYRVVEQALKMGLNGHPPCSECPVRPRKCAYSVEDD